MVTIFNRVMSALVCIIVFTAATIGVASLLALVAAFVSGLTGSYPPPALNTLVSIVIGLWLTVKFIRKATWLE